MNWNEALGCLALKDFLGLVVFGSSGHKKIQSQIDRYYT